MLFRSGTCTCCRQGRRAPEKTGRQRWHDPDCKSTVGVSCCATLANHVSQLARYLHRRIVDAEWIRANSDAKAGSPCAGIVIKSEATGDYIAEPSNTYPELAQFCQRLKINAAFTMSCALTDTILECAPAHEDEVSLPSGITIPVVSSLRELATTDR